jgi:hypothetical protein
MTSPRGRDDAESLPDFRVRGPAKKADAYMAQLIHAVSIDLPIQNLVLRLSMLFIAVLRRRGPACTSRQLGVESDKCEIVSLCRAGAENGATLD